MTEGELHEMRFTLETFGEVPRETKSRLTAVEWEQVKIVAKSGHIGADRRDLGLAYAAQAIANSQGGKVQAKDILPVKFWRDNTEEEDAAAIESLG